MPSAVFWKRNVYGDIFAMEPAHIFSQRYYLARLATHFAIFCLAKLEQVLAGVPSLSHCTIQICSGEEKAPII
uniref:Uncharacterized protein n=1 Tax=Aegilops tauschii subsp. strangulata TaxID=200361 RepID=A0A452XFG1_AEGTS